MPFLKDVLMLPFPYLGIGGKATNKINSKGEPLPAQKVCALA
jgi:hypothetical protein